MQLFEQEHIGRRRLATLRELLMSRYPEFNLDALAARHNVLPDWSNSRDGSSMVAFIQALRDVKYNGVPDIALQIGDRAQLTDSGLLGYAVLTAPTVLHAARISSHALNSSSYIVRTKISTRDGISRIVITTLSHIKPYEEELLEMSALAVWRCTQVILPSGRGTTPSYVTFKFPKPPHAEQYQALFGCPVEFSQAHNVIAWPAEWMHYPIPTGRADLMQTCSAQMKQLLGEGYYGTGIIARVKRALIEHPKTCDFSLAGTAQQLKIQERSLRRYLSQADTSFRRVCLEVRMELAQQYLRQTSMPLKAIAYQLGYRHANNFNRAYREFYGATPQDIRLRHQAAAAPPAAAELAASALANRPR